MTDQPEPRPGFYATSRARNATGHADEALTLALHGKEWDIGRQLADAEKYLRKALDHVTLARAARDTDERARQMNAELPPADHAILKLKGMI